MTSRRTIAEAPCAVIAATRSFGAPLAALWRFLLAAMRGGGSVAMLIGVALRCLIVDDNPSFLDAARVLLGREGVEVVGVASTSAEALRRVAELAPDVTLVDVILGEESGFELARRMELAGSTVVLISTHAEADIEDLIADSHAAGFLPKSQLSASGIRRILDGRSPEVRS